MRQSAVRVISLCVLALTLGSFEAGLAADQCNGSAFLDLRNGGLPIPERFKLAPHIQPPVSSRTHPVVNQFAQEFESGGAVSKIDLSALKRNVRADVIDDLGTYIGDRPDAYEKLQSNVSGLTKAELKLLKEMALESDDIAKARLMNADLVPVRIRDELPFPLPKELRESLEYARSVLHRYGRSLEVDAVSPLDRYHASVVQKYTSADHLTATLIRRYVEQPVRNLNPFMASPERTLWNFPVGKKDAEVIEDMVQSIRFFSVKQAGREPTVDELIESVRIGFEAAGRKPPKVTAKVFEDLKARSLKTDAVPVESKPIVIKPTGERSVPTTETIYRKHVETAETFRARRDALDPDRKAYLSSMARGLYGDAKIAVGQLTTAERQADLVYRYFVQNGQFPVANIGAGGSGASQQLVFDAYTQLKKSAGQSGISTDASRAYQKLLAQTELVQRVVDGRQPVPAEWSLAVNASQSAPPQVAFDQSMHARASDLKPPERPASTSPVPVHSTAPSVESVAPRETVASTPQDLSARPSRPATSTRPKDKPWTIDELDLSKDDFPTAENPLVIEVIDSGGRRSNRKISFTQKTWSAMKTTKSGYSRALIKTIRALSAPVPVSSDWKFMQQLPGIRKTRTLELRLPSILDKHPRVFGCLDGDGSLSFKLFLKSAPMTAYNKVPIIRDLCP